jgi:hypothetical protein
MREARGGPRLLQEAVPIVGAGREMRREQFDRDGAVERHIPGQQHDPHATSPELALDRIAAGEHFLQRQAFGVDRCRHVSSSYERSVRAFRGTAPGRRFTVRKGARTRCPTLLGQVWH